MTRASKTTLENPLLYNNFLKAIERNNPEIEIDPDDIDRTLEYDEAFNELKELYPGCKYPARKKAAFSRMCEVVRDIKWYCQ